MLIMKKVTGKSIRLEETTEAEEASNQLMIR